LGASFFHGKSYEFILTKNGLGNILGDYFHTLLVTLLSSNFAGCLEESLLKISLSRNQGDRIGRMLSYRAIVYFVQRFENYSSTATKIWATFFHNTSYVLILTNNFLGYIFGRFFNKLI
jgi:hypothetical protein